jgi:protein disulfide-isomerase A6
VATPISSIPDGLSLQQKCLNDKASTCILAILPANDEPTPDSTQAIAALSEIHRKYEATKHKLFPFYQLPSSNSQATALRKLLSLSDGIELIAVNGKRGWYRHLDSSAGLTTTTIEAWVDAIRMDDLAKTKLPEHLVVPRDALPAEPVKYEPVTNDPESMRQQLKNQMPEGVDFEFEEIDDDEYDRIMKESAKAKEEKKVEVETEHDEL